MDHQCLGKRKEGPGVLPQPKHPRPEDMEEFRKMHLETLQAMQQSQERQLQALMSVLSTVAGSMQGVPQAHVLPSSAAAASAQPPAMPSVVPQPAAQAQAGSKLVNVESLKDTEIEKEINPQLKKHIHKVSRKFEDNLEKWGKAKLRVERDQEDLKVLESGEFRYPQGMRPFKSPVESAGLDDPWGETSAGDIEFKVTIPQNKTRREAMQLVHHASAVFMRKRMFEANSVYLQHLNTKITKTAFMEGINSWEQPQDPDLGLEEGLKPVPNATAVADAALKAYTDIITKFRKKSAEDEKLKKEKKTRRSA